VRYLPIPLKTTIKRLILVALLVTGLAVPSFADVTVKATASDTTRTMIFDVDNQRLYSFDSKKKEADAADLFAPPAGYTIKEQK